MMVVQAELKSGTAVRTCWLKQGIKVGNEVTLKNSEEPDRRWEIIRVGTEVRDLESINWDWNNNI